MKARIPSDVPGWDAEKTKRLEVRARKSARKSSLDGKSLDLLTPPEKDILLAALCERCGLLDADGKLTL
jgi:hypothetical protein